MATQEAIFIRGFAAGNRTAGGNRNGTTGAGATSESDRPAGFRPPKLADDATADRAMVPPMTLRWLTFPGLMATMLTADAVAAADGAALYAKHCAMCHQATGAGLPGVFPPLAGSDFVKNERSRAIRAVCEGLSGPIKVNGKDYNSAMPLVVLSDAEASAVLSHVFSSWGNEEKPVTAAEVAEERARTKFPTYAKLVAAQSYAPLPSPPEGWALREVGQLPISPTRLLHRAGDATVLMLELNGNVWRFDPATGVSELALPASTYIDPALGGPMTMGMAWDRDGRFYVVANQRNEKKTPITNEVTVFRTKPGQSPAGIAEPAPWFRTGYPWGIGGFNHGLTHMAQGPDGMLHLSSGSRTDGNEPGGDARLSKEGEVPVSGCLWRLDPAAETPELEVFCRGLRNPYGFCWTPDGRLWATDNGPDADAPEELNWLREGRHYGFPYRFSDWAEKPYPHTPKAPDGLELTDPVVNLGPQAGFEAKPGALSTFSPHSSPAGLVWLESDVYPAPFRHSFLVTRFGNLLKKERDTGFDLVRVSAVSVGENRLAAEVHTVLAPLARPIDIVEWKPGTLLIAEYGRATTFEGGLGQPGRMLELSVTAK